MGEDEVREEVEVKKSINAWRQSERKVMIETVQDLIQTSHKYAKSQYTPNAQRVRWTKLAGQLIWYKDQTIVFRKPEERKAEDGEIHAEAKENVSSSS